MPNGVNGIASPKVQVCCLELDEVHNKLQGRLISSVFVKTILTDKNLITQQFLLQFCVLSSIDWRSYSVFLIYANILQG